MQLNFINTLPCQVNIEYNIGASQNTNILLNATQYEFVQDLKADETILARAYLTSKDCGPYVQFEEGYDTGFIDLGVGSKTLGYSILITERDMNLTMTRLQHEEQLEKSTSGNPLVA